VATAAALPASINVTIGLPRSAALDSWAAHVLAVAKGGPDAQKVVALKQSTG
jgi:hypothetical protein